MSESTTGPTEKSDFFFEFEFETAPRLLMFLLYCSALSCVLRDCAIGNQSADL